MDVIDSQVHLWQSSHHSGPLNLGNEVSAELDELLVAAAHHYSEHELSPDEFVAKMDLADVSGAIVVTPLIHPDNDYSLAAYRRWPDRYRVVAKLDVEADLEDVGSQWDEEPGFVGFRLNAAGSDERDRIESGYFDPLLRIAAAGALTVCLIAPGWFDGMARLAARFDEAQFVIDHLGVLPTPLAPSSSELERAVGLKALAALPNVMVKLSQLPALSSTGEPYEDLWPTLHSIIDAFGPDRCMWGSDQGWFPHVSYDVHVDLIRKSREFSQSEKELILGGTARRAFVWS